MDDELALKTEFRQALDEVLPPAPWLAAAVGEHVRKRQLRGAQPRSTRKSDGSFAALPRPVFQLVAAVVILALATSALVIFFELHDHTQQNTPAGALTVSAYQDMVSRDDGELIVARNDDCSTLQSACPATGRITALQRWLDDLDRSTPPATFAVIDGQIRRHLAANIMYTTAEFGAYQAGDQGSLDRLNYATGIGAFWLDQTATSIISTRRGTVSDYTSAARAGELSLSSCASCESLRAGSFELCAQTQPISCLYPIHYTERVVGDFEASLVQVGAPGSMARADASLQGDLARADTALIALTTAMLSGDPASFNADHALLQQALTAIKADTAAIVGS